jgi:hypothetical protein
MGGMPARSLVVGVIALVALGLVGMHHLVVAACHHGATHGDHAAVLSMDSVIDHGVGDHGTHDPTPPADAPAPDGAPGGLVGAAATCLAILLMVVGLVLPQVLARLRRWQAMRLTLVSLPVITRAPKPPELTLLSVSRT